MDHRVNFHRLILDEPIFFFKQFMHLQGKKGQATHTHKKLKLLIFMGSMGLLALLSPLSAEIISDPFQNSGLINANGEYTGFIPKGDIRRFNGEILSYDVDFLFFDNAASAKVRFYENNGRYFSTLAAETKGIVGFFTDYRKHYYKSSFDIIDNGQRVRTLKFERKVINGDYEERTTHYLDYQTQTHSWFLFKGGDLDTRETEYIPDDVFFDDILAMFYNFRNGVYGPLTKGKSYRVDTIPDQSMKHITTRIETLQEEEKFRKETERPKKDELLLRVKIPKDVFKTENGELIFWASPHYIPLETTVKDYVLLGDLHARLTGGIAGKLAPVVQTKNQDK